MLVEKIRQGGFQPQLLSFNIECTEGAAVKPARREKFKYLCDVNKIV